MRTADFELRVPLDAGNGLIWRDDRVGVLPTLALRWTKSSKTDQSIHMKVIWE